VTAGKSRGVRAPTSVVVSPLTLDNLGFLLAKTSQRWNELLYERFVAAGFRIDPHRAPVGKRQARHSVCEVACLTYGIKRRMTAFVSTPLALRLRTLNWAVPCAFAYAPTPPTIAVVFTVAFPRTPSLRTMCPPGR
jgi:hypothetical protein